MDKPMPCPFCGSPAKHRQNEFGDWYECSNRQGFGEGCPARKLCMTLEQWNQRRPQAAESVRAEAAAREIMNLVAEAMTGKPDPEIFERCVQMCAGVVSRHFSPAGGLSEAQMIGPGASSSKQHNPWEPAAPASAGWGKPIDAVLHCPDCGHQHIDAPEPENGWTNPPHRKHLCHYCGHIWLAANVPTNGVLLIEPDASRSNPA